MREYGVEKCACGACKLVRDHSSLPWEWAAWGVRKLNYCPSCGTRVGTDERGPWREEMVPRAALEWLADMSEGCAQVSPCPANKPLSDANKEALCRECLVQAALKAAEEASDE